MAAKPGPDFNWECMLKWWSAHSDDDIPVLNETTHSPVSEDIEIDGESETDDSIDDAPDGSLDVAGRVHAIAHFFTATKHDKNVEFLTPAQMEACLDELQGYVEYVDVAFEIQSVYGLRCLFYNVLYYEHGPGVYNQHAGVRAKAAEVVTTMLQNNPSSQQLVMEVDGLEPLLYNVISDPDATSRTKALGAIYSLIRNNKPGITAFLLGNGYAALKDALSSESVSFQSKALGLIQYLLHENHLDYNKVTELGFPLIMMHLISSDDAEVREATLRCLLVLTRDDGGNSGQLVKNHDKLKSVLQERIEGISALVSEDLGAARKERQLLDSLWNACYNEPSSLGEKGLLVLPGEDAPAPFLIKSVCKSWRDLIQRSSYIDLHTATTLNSSSSYSKFGSFILHAIVEKYAPTTRDYLSEHAVFMLSSESDSEGSVSRSGSGSVGCWWSTTGSDYINLWKAKDDRPDDRVFKVEEDNLGGGGSNDDDQLVLKLDKLGFPSSYKFSYFNKQIAGSCNGLVCLHNRRTSRCHKEPYEVSLWNPATGQFKLLPKSITVDGYRRSRVLVALGFDVVTMDYKVMLLSGLKSMPNGDGPMNCFCRVQVYSLRTDSWRLLEGIHCLPGFHFFGSFEDTALYLNGSCFFVAHFFFTKQQPCLPVNDRFIISFDFTKEIITPIQLPDHNRNQELYLCYLGDKIALFTTPKHDTPVGSYVDFNIWVLNEHGSSSSSSSSVNKESWKRLHSFQIEIERPVLYIPRGISNDGKFALLETRYSSPGLSKKMNLYNLVTKEVKWSFLSCDKVMSKAYAYKPSLVSIIRGSGAAAAAAADSIG